MRPETPAPGAEIARLAADDFGNAAAMPASTSSKIAGP
jgi:hypothetical protein